MLAALLLLAACEGAEPPPHLRVVGGDAERGLAAIRQRGCASCHVIPGISDPAGVVGPTLIDFAARGYVAGVLPNWPQYLVPWIMDPPAFVPYTAMPDMGIPVAEARDIAAYLYTLGAARARVDVPAPRLPLATPEERQRVESAAAERLSRYGWTDRQRGLAHIPLNRAIELMQPGD